MNNKRFTKIASTFTFLVSFISFSLITPLLIFGLTLGLIWIFPTFYVDTTFLTIIFLLSCTLYNSFVIFTIKLWGKHVEDGEDIGHYFSILVPANNEENVIEKTLKRFPFNLEGN
ncbi:MAG: hypothetical protein P8Y18_00270 [Candidatus Bathyarchaeota archaeon]